MNNFKMTNMPKVYFGQGALKEALNTELKTVGDNVLLAYGGGSIKKTGIYDEVVTLLKEAGKNIFEFNGIMSNPTYAKVLEGAKIVKDNQIDFIIAVGGGSVIDCCKIVSAQAKVDQDIWQMEFVDGKLPTEFIPMAAVTTASGTGSEMNNGAVITNEELKIKAGMLGALSKFAVLDPAYTLTVPMKQVVSGAFDTLSHAMETYFGKPLENNVSDEINEAIMRNTIRNIRAAIKEPQDIQARSELMWDSAMAENGILKLGKVTDFQAHQIEHQLGAYTDCNHGQGLAVIHPVLYRHIYEAGVSKFARFAKEVWHVDDTNLTEKETALKGIEALADFIKEIGLPTTLTQMNITDVDMLKKVADSSNITAGCCKQLSHDEIFEILKECL
ncbi:NADH-dependent alcohol dehydrogenase [Erysipelatoclostridium sp. An15]|uniref:Iron-containing alcohol dehydrogenase n=1 Tax=Candidatus Erysipelatoclostridium merdavium TaxID=2838566 RepID=A0A9D1XKY5_9FIRM|nr:iron-containing alcohol dehydrogenase [Erysipelatoclostridium sp. An15]OUQ08006.1 NADH-dependent alcohol dehydrogenase [Erysipelatoclostridium sp. An15]HIX81150.1 iron-containing alcohol dehydrogenase [Candidatus Erysipelatoclostridium merdavium]